jgi:glycosyl hydrolase family 43
MRRNLRATLGALALLVTTVAGGLAIGAVAPSAAGATTTTPHMGTTSNGVVAPVSGTTHTDFPDPAVVSSGTANTYYAYSTGTASALGTVPASWTNGGIGGTTIGCSTSSCTDETARTVALSITSAPATITRFWGLEAPSVVYLGGRWVMYYGGVYTAANQVYGAYDATSPTPTSGFTPTSSAPLMYQAATGGSSDPSAFIRPTGQPWLLWKSATWKGAPKAKLWSMQLTTGGTRMKSGASEYVLANQPAGGWTGTTTVENPQMVWSGGTYYLFYSGGHWTRTTYGEGYLTCTGPTGDSGATCGTPNTHEILSSATNAEGPGGGSLFTTSTGTWLMAFHGWTGTCSVGATTSYYKCPAARQLYVRPVGGLFSTSLPRISAFAASSYTVPASGATVHLVADATRTVSYTFLSSPGPTGLPAFVNTAVGGASTTVHIPANTSTSPVHYTFAVYATGPYGGQVSDGLGVTQLPRPPVISSFSPTTNTMTASGGDLHFAVGATGATSFQISASPSISGIPTNSTTVDVPPNMSGSEIRYTFTLTATNSGGSSTKTAIVTVKPASYLHLTYVSSTDRLHIAGWNPITQSWVDGIPTTSGLVTAEGGSSILQYEGSLFIMYLDKTGNIHDAAYNPATKVWSNNPIPSSVKAQGRLAVATYRGDMEVAYIGQNGQLHDDVWTGTKWTDAALHWVTAQGSPSILEYEGSFFIMYLDKTGNIHDAAYNPTTKVWSNNPIPSSVKAQDTLAVVTYEGTIEVVYIGQNGQLHNDAWAGTTWNDSIVPPAVSAQGSPSAIVLPY